MQKKLYQELAQLVDAYHRCEDSGNMWQVKHRDNIEALAKNLLPHGSGYDSGTTVNIMKSRRDRLVLHTSFHHMNENGFYCGWTEHDVIVTPSLLFGFELLIKGKDRNQIKEMMYEDFRHALSLTVSKTEAGSYRVWDDFQPDMVRTIIA